MQTINISMFTCLKRLPIDEYMNILIAYISVIFKMAYNFTNEILINYVIFKYKNVLLQFLSYTPFWGKKYNVEIALHCHTYDCTYLHLCHQCSFKNGSCGVILDCDSSMDDCDHLFWLPTTRFSCAHQTNKKADMLPEREPLLLLPLLTPQPFRQQMCSSHTHQTSTSLDTSSGPAVQWWC